MNREFIRYEKWRSSTDTICIASGCKHSAEVYSPPGGATVMGHLHRIEAVHAVRHGGAQGYSGGCHADIPRLHYAATRHGTMRWANGWLYGVIEEGL